MLVAGDNNSDYDDVGDDGCVDDEEALLYHDICDVFQIHHFCVNQVDPRDKVTGKAE